VTAPDAERLFRLSDQRDAILRRVLDAEKSGYEAGFVAGYDQAQRDADQAWRDTPPLRLRDGITHEELERRRRHVCCRQCRIAGCKPGCGRCEDRDLATFGQRHPDDYPHSEDGRAA
jgi:hypothetical protein